MGRDTLRKVRDESGHPERCPGRVGTPYGWSKTRLGTLGEIRDGSGDTRGGAGTLREVQNGLRDPRKDPGWVKDSRGDPGWVGDLCGDPGQVEGPSGRSGTGQDTLREVWDRSGHPPGG